jgi:nitrogen regulatory protein PII
MKLITAIIQPHKLDEVKSALVSLGNFAMTSTEVSGFGRQKGHLEIYRGTEYVIDFVHKIKLEIICRDDEYDSIINIISKTARSGKIGDGKIFIQKVSNAYRIRTGESGNLAL